MSLWWMSQESFHFSASFAFNPSADCWPTVPFAAARAAASSPFPAFLLHVRSSGGTRAAINVLLLRKARSTRAHSKWLFLKHLCDLQPGLALRRLPLTEIPLTSLSDAAGLAVASFYQSNSQCWVLSARCAVSTRKLLRQFWKEERKSNELGMGTIL